ncbi:MAG: hypothetical protein PVJ75_12940, partial [Chloroflexota bacterium]
EAAASVSPYSSMVVSEKHADPSSLPQKAPSQYKFHNSTGCALDQDENVCFQSYCVANIVDSQT